MKTFEDVYEAFILYNISVDNIDINHQLHSHQSYASDRVASLGDQRIKLSLLVHDVESFSVMLDTLKQHVMDNKIIDQYPAVKEAFDHYQTLLKLCDEEYR